MTDAKKIITQVKAGDTVKAYGYEFEVLDTEYETEDGNKKGILCLTKDIVKMMAFSEDNDNDYSKSDVKKYIEELTEELREKGAVIYPVRLDLTADDGTGWDKESLYVDGGFLLTGRMYQDYRRYISDKSDWWWLATAYSFSFGNPLNARLVSTVGALGTGSAYSGNNGVVPAYVFSFLPDEKKAEIREIREQISELVKRLDAMEATVK